MRVKAVNGTRQAPRNVRTRRERAVAWLLPHRAGIARRPPSTTTTWWALAMYFVVLTLGSALFGLLLAVFMSRVGWTGPYPIDVLASIIPALAVFLLVLLQTWDLVQIERYRQPMQILPPGDGEGLPEWAWAAIVVAVVAAAFVLGRLFWG